MKSYLIKNAQLVNEGSITESDVLIKNGRIEKIANSISEDTAGVEKVIDASGLHLLPGFIDDQVHFREPGLTHKANIYTESRAAVAGGITSFMEMPNTKPQTLTQELLEKKYKIGAKTALANYSFYMGVSNDNLSEALRTDKQNVCGLKVFMGSSTGDMLVDSEEVLNGIFSKSDLLIATHCEDEETIRRNSEKFKVEFGNQVPIEFHPMIRSEEACYISSSLAVSLAKKHNTRLHILHISTGKEVGLFDNKTPLKDKRITAEACIHHLWFNNLQYQQYGTFIKWNPAVKTPKDQDAILAGLLDDHIDVIATDHAPHTLKEKQNTYFNAPSGGPLVQHALQALLEMHRKGKISLEKIVEKMSHNVAICFDIVDRGYIREGYFADLVLVDLNANEIITRNNILYKCGWSPFEATTFHSKITHTFVSGHLAYDNGEFDESKMGERLQFDRS